MIGYRFARMFGFNHHRARWLSNQLTPIAIDNSLSHDYPTAWERMDNQMDVNTHMFNLPAIQFKLEVNEPGDAAEQEADATAEKIVNPALPDQAPGQFFRPAARPLQRESDQQSTPAVPGTVPKLLQQPGAPLPAEVRRFFEGRFGHDFSKVRIHTGREADETSKALQARAYTAGDHIVFANGEYNPGSTEGKRLLAHELTHVIQQSQSIPGEALQRQLMAGADLGGGNRAVISDATTAEGVYTDVAGFINLNNIASLAPHIFVITYGGMSVFTTATGNQVRHYALRGRERMLPFGLWEIDSTGGMTRAYLNAENRVRPADAWYFESLEGFSPERQAIIHGRGNVITLEDFVDVSISDLQSSQFLPALIMSSDIQAGGGGSGGGQGEHSGPPQPAPWATSQVRELMQSLMGGSSSATTTSSERDTQTDQCTPDRVVQWVRQSDGAQFINVHAGGENQALELRDGETLQQLQQRVENATTRMRERQTQRAVDEERRTTGGNIPYNDSTFLGGTNADGPRPNRPAYRADISGPEVMVREGTGAYNMHLHYEDVDPTLLGQVVEAFGGAEYTWQIIDITALYQQIISERRSQIRLQQLQLEEGITPTPAGPTASEQDLTRMGRTDAVSADTTVTAYDQAGRDLSRTAGNFAEDAVTAWTDLSHPLDSADGSAEGAIRSVLVNSFNLSTLPLHAIMSLGGWLVRSFAAVFHQNHDYEREVPFPNRDGYYLIRCVAQPRPRGEGENMILRMPSVAVKVVEVKEIQERTRQELDAQDQTLQANILELLIAYRITTDAGQLRTIRQQLELKIQEAAQSNRRFLEEEITNRQDQLGQPDVADDIKQKLREEIDILQQGTRSSSGTIAMIITRQIQLKEIELEAARQRNDTLRIRQIERDMETLRSRLLTASEREREMTASGQALARPQAVFVNEADGRTIPLLIEIGQMGARHTTRGYTMRVSDITGNDSDQHDAIGSTRATAVRNALREYAGHFPYGRGYLMVRMPASNNFGITEVITLRCNPHDTAQASERLDELLQVLAIIGLAIPGVGIAAAAVGAAVSAARLLHRLNNHTFDWDMNAIMDMVNILGAVAGGVSRFAGGRLIRAQRMFALVEGDADMAAWVTRLDRMARVARITDTALNYTGYFLGTMETVNNYLEIQREELAGNITHAEARRRRAQLMARAIQDQIMQFAPDVAEAVRERREADRRMDDIAHGRDPEERRTGDDDESPQSRQRQDRRQDEQQQQPPPDQQQQQRREGDDTGIPVPIPVHPAPHTGGGPQVPDTPAARIQRVEAFLNVRENRLGLLRGDQRVLRELLATHGIWRDLIMHLQSRGAANEFYAHIVEELVNMRRTLVLGLTAAYQLEASGRGSTEPGSDVDLATSGNDAGRRLLEAEAFMREHYGPNWSQMLRMNFYTSAERLSIYERVRGQMSDEAFGQMQGHFTALAEEMNFAKMLQHAAGNPDSIRRVEAMMAHLSPEQQAAARRRAGETPAVSQVVVAQLHLHIDGLMARFNAMAATDPARIELAREITRMQMEANFRTQEAYISPGAGRHVVGEVAVRGHEAYQSAISNLEMMEHILHIAGGNIETAVREYELYKYISRFIEAMQTAGLPLNSFMMAYYQAAYNVHQGNRTQLQGVSRQDLSYLQAMHNQFVTEAAAVLPQLRQAATDAPSEWNPTARSLRPGAGGVLDTTRETPTEDGTRSTAEPDLDESFRQTFDIPPAPRHVKEEINPAITHPTEDGHTLAVTRDGRIFRCSVCEQLLSTYQEVLAAHPELRVQLEMIMQRLGVSSDSQRREILINEVRPLDRQLQQLEAQRLSSPTTTATTAPVGDPNRIWRPGDADFHSELQVGETRRYEDTDRTRGVASRPSQDVYRVQAPLNYNTATRGEFQRAVDRPPGLPSGENGFEALHAIGPMLGHEGPYGILFGPFALNRFLQEHGVESFIRDFGRPGSGITFDLRVTVERAFSTTYPGAEFMRGVQYEIIAYGSGIASPVVIFRSDIRVNQPDNPRSTYELGGFIHPNIDRFLAPPASPPAGAAPARRTRRTRGDVSTATGQQLLTGVRDLATRLRSIPSTDSRSAMARQYAMLLMEKIRNGRPDFVTRDMILNVQQDIDDIRRHFPDLAAQFSVIDRIRAED